MNERNDCKVRGLGRNSRGAGPGYSFAAPVALLLLHCGNLDDRTLNQPDGGAAGNAGAMSGGRSGGTTGTGAASASGGSGKANGGVGGKSVAEGGTTSEGGSTGPASGGTPSGAGEGAGGDPMMEGGQGGEGSTTGGSGSGGAAGQGATGGTTGGTSTGGKASGGTSTGGTTAVIPPSCTGLSAQCQGESCCTSISVPGGTFKMGRSLVPTDADYSSATEGDDTPEHSATVAAFKLDKYEVTVGRFRKFHASYRQWHVTGQNPKTGAGLHPIVGHTGWGQSWPAAASDLPADEVALAASASSLCETTQPTWTATASSPNAPAESYPINCISWYTAFAFCLWDGGRLPTEAEWEFVAAGGQSNYLYPWGATVDNTRTNYSGSENTPYLPVGSKPAGAGTLGHRDLAGSVREWVFDFFQGSYYGTLAAPATCNNCAHYGPASDIITIRVNRGGSWNGGGLRAAYRETETAPLGRSGSLGVRCARN